MLASPAPGTPTRLSVARSADSARLGSSRLDSTRASDCHNKARPHPANQRQAGGQPGEAERAAAGRLCASARRTRPIGQTADRHLGPTAHPLRPAIARGRPPKPSGAGRRVDVQKQRRIDLSVRGSEVAHPTGINPLLSALSTRLLARGLSIFILCMVTTTTTTSYVTVTGTNRPGQRVEI
ncbi:unnamed protein product [Protopolystoma xenopodis]|uniref:Uncharacterized protein n=1 Tax=Protopolystoma xenopodis TaxID=117903 RepID=A0A448XIX9_9PLAT|nr:unnamed protein product [Protopolystoma xenopodis]